MWIDCVLWSGYTNGKAGYGQLKVDGRHVLAHRWVYENWVGPIPDGWEIDHLCRVTLCVNAEHLEAVTPREQA